DILLMSRPPLLGQGGDWVAAKGRCLFSESAMNDERLKRGKPALKLIEEAIHVLRSSPAATLASYYTGAIPFVVGFLYFWTDMSRSPFANRHVAEAALAVTGLFLWMKLCQAFFTQRIQAQVAGRPMPSWNGR